MFFPLQITAFIVLCFGILWLFIFMLNLHSVYNTFAAELHQVFFSERGVNFCTQFYASHMTHIVMQNVFSIKM